MSTNIKIILGLIVGVIVGCAAMILLRPTQTHLVGEASGAGVPTVLDNLNTTGSIVTNVSQSNPTVFPTGLVGSIYAANTLAVGGSQTIATSGSGTLLASAIEASTLFYVPAAGTGAVTLTLPATTSLTAFIPNQGDCQQLVINVGSTTAGLVTLAGNTGVNLRTGSTTSAIVGGGDGVIDFCRIAGTAIDAILDVQAH